MLNGRQSIALRSKQKAPSNLQLGTAPHTDSVAIPQMIMIIPHICLESCRYAIPQILDLQSPILTVWKVASPSPSRLIHPILRKPTNHREGNPSHVAKCHAVIFHRKSARDPESANMRSQWKDNLAMALALSGLGPRPCARARPWPCPRPRLAWPFPSRPPWLGPCPLGYGPLPQCGHH